MTRARVVVDTNVLISRLLLPASVSARAVRQIVEHSQLLASEATLTELADVLSRDKFDRYVDVSDRQAFFLQLVRIVERVPITYLVHGSRDQKDDMFLELAVNGHADYIVSGDQDLLLLSPFRDIPILNPARYLEQVNA